MTDHDELCPWPAPDVEPEDCAYCELIFSTRVDERERMERVASTATITRNADESLSLRVDDPYSTRWVPVSLDVIADLPGAYNDGLARARADERDRIAQAIAALREADSLPGYVIKRNAARIARNGGRDE